MERSVGKRQGKSVHVYYNTEKAQNWKKDIYIYIYLYISPFQLGIIECAIIQNPTQNAKLHKNEYFLHCFLQ